MRMFSSFALFALASLFFDPNTASAADVTLVRFGASAGATTFGLTGWNTLLKSGSLDYSARGNGGLIATSDPGEYGDFRGVRGTARKFSKGERIAVTWYNDSDESFFFTARISFTDADEPDESGAEGHWYTMRSFADYRFTYSEILPHATAKTVFNITDSGVHKTDSTFALVNINLAIEWGSTYQKPFLICEKIELLDDADVTPPAQPTGLTATALSDSKIALDWDEPSDDVGAVEYLVFVDGVIEGYSQSTEDTCVFLEPATEYTFFVTAWDAAGNESAPSDPASATTQSYRGRSDLINPAGLEYLGAIAVPEDFAWGGEAIAYHPNGDGGQTNSADDFPGSLFVTNLNQPENGLVGEVSIPPPVISPGKNPDDLNMASVLTPPVNIRPANVNSWDFVDVWRTGLEVVPAEGRLYSTWSYHYTVSGEKHASISCCDLSDLAGSPKYGAWFLGDPGLPPIDAMSGDWLFSIPQDWANAYGSGRTLVTGRCRDGGLSGLGPTLYAFAPVGATPPASGQSLDFTTLLEYGSVEGTDNVHFPHAVEGYNHADDWRGAAWLVAKDEQYGGTLDAVAIIGNKALGDNWYGYRGERMRHDWVIADLPYPDFWETDPDGKGWRSHTRQPMILFYNPMDLSAVANGEMESYTPQPYAALRIPNDLFFGHDHEIFSSTFDSENHLLYVTEFVRELEGRLFVHAWKINYMIVSVHQEEDAPLEFRLCQNYPNPFNPETVIEYTVKESCRVVLKVFDLQGREVTTLVDGVHPSGFFKVRFDGSGLASGIYFCRIWSKNFVEVKKMVLLE